MGRKQKTTDNPANPITFKEIPLRPPPASGRPSGQKTLVDIIDENRPKNPDGTPIVPHDADEEVVFGPVMQTVSYTIPLAMLLAGFDVLVHMQYRQEVENKIVMWRVLKAIPVIFMMVYIFHPRRFRNSVQLLFLAVSIAAGCWLVRAVNKTGYYAVMKRAPPVGMLWIWSIVELRLGLALISCAAVWGYTRYQGFTWF